MYISILTSQRVNDIFINPSYLEGQGYDHGLQFTTRIKINFVLGFFWGGGGKKQKWSWFIFELLHGQYKSNNTDSVTYLFCYTMVTHGVGMMTAEVYSNGHQKSPKVYKKSWKNRTGLLIMLPVMSMDILYKSILKKLKYWWSVSQKTLFVEELSLRLKKGP